MYVRLAKTFIYQVGRVARYARFRCPREVEQPGNEMGLAPVVGNNAEARTAAAAMRRVSTATDTVGDLGENGVGERGGG